MTINHEPAQVTQDAIQYLVKNGNDVIHDELVKLVKGG